MLTKVLFCFTLLSLAHAHSGFNTLAWQDTWGDYTLTVLEDFHSGEGEAQLFVQLSNGDDAAPQATAVNAVIRLENETIYEGTIPLTLNGSSDGKTFYAGYLLTFPLEKNGVYQIAITASGPLGHATAKYVVRSRGESLSVLEYLPSLIILFISVGGAALLFIPSKRKDRPHEAKDDFSLIKPAHTS